MTVSLSRGNGERSGARMGRKRLAVISTTLKVVIAVMKQVKRTLRMTKTHDRQSGRSFAQYLPMRV